MNSRVAGLDGVRGLAVLFVVLYHSTLRELPIGAVGVETFFVLSGFLITDILSREYDRRHDLDVPRFWLARAVRLFPTLAVAVVVVTIDGFVLQGRLDESVIPTLTYSANWFQVARQHSVTLGVAWSLAVEEQFYLLWPFALLLILRRGIRPLHIVLPAALLANASRLALFWAWGANPWVYQGTECHLDTILAGAALALWRRERRAQLAPSWAAPLGCMSLLLACVPQPWSVLTTGPLVSVGASLVILCLVEESRHGALAWARWRPLIWLGTISYSLYLWHEMLIGPVLAAEHGLAIATWAEWPAYYAFALLAGWLSYAITERPFLELRRRLRDRTTTVSHGLEQAAGGELALLGASADVGTLLRTASNLADVPVRSATN
jgi:peptidoglycan/LPS O-acetylase OafA/YrhL